MTITGDSRLYSSQLFHIVLCYFIILFAAFPIEASVGDQSNYFQNCINNLYTTVCDNITRVMEMKHTQSLSLRLTMWSCQDECKYQCMWAAVKYFLTHFKQVPQFYGKVPLK